ncbi:MAG: hypothetical protein HC890_05155 [Chloroflexaceae bacterium]|nr:hypothetical protein [Chloroflexaceae bacterium]
MRLITRCNVTIIGISLAVQLVSSLTIQPALAQALFDNPRTFIVSRSCNATTSIKKQTEPVALEINQKYPAFAENRRSNPTHVFLDVDNARKWVALECGRYAELPNSNNNSQPLFSEETESENTLNLPNLQGQNLSAIAFNVESDDVEDTDPIKVAQDIRRIPAADVWGLSEVANEDAANIFTGAVGEDYGSILGTTGSNDKLQIIYNKERLALIRSEELDEVEGTRKPLVAQFKLQPEGLEFLFTVNHFNRRNEDLRNAQAEELRQWAARQSLPVLAVGDFNLDFDPIRKKGNAAFDIFLKDDVLEWIQPPCIVTNSCPSTGTQCNPNFNSILDFVFVAGEAKKWGATSSVLFIDDSDYCRREKEGFSDHRPVSATFQLP